MDETAEPEYKPAYCLAEGDHERFSRVKPNNSNTVNENKEE